VPGVLVRVGVEAGIAETASSAVLRTPSGKN